MPKALSEFEKKIGKNLRNYRITRDISQQKLAKYLNLPKQIISRMENGKRKISIEELEKIALFFDQPIQLFMKDEFKYVHPSETDYGVFTVYMAEFLDDYRKGLNVDAGKNNHTNRLTNKFIEALKTIRREELSKQKDEHNNLRKGIND